MGYIDGVSKSFKNLLNNNKENDLTIDGEIQPRDLEYLIHYLKTDNIIQKVTIPNYNFVNHNIEKKIKNMYDSNITLQEFFINGDNKINCNLNKNIWKNYKNFYRKKNMNPKIYSSLHNNEVNYFKTKDGKIDINNLGEFINFLEEQEKNGEINSQSIFKIKKKIVQIKKDDIKKNGIGSILSNLKVLYLMRQNNQNDLNKKLEFMK